MEKANKELENKKSASIQKIEKDIENLSKKSNFQLKTDFDDDSFEQSDMNNDNLSRSPLDDLQGNYSDALTSLLTSSTKISHNDSFEVKKTFAKFQINSWGFKLIINSCYLIRYFHPMKKAK